MTRLPRRGKAGDKSMAALTEDLILKKTGAETLAAVKNLNLWGSDLSDVSILEVSVRTRALWQCFASLTRISCHPQSPERSSNIIRSDCATCAAAMQCGGAISFSQQDCLPARFSQLPSAQRAVSPQERNFRHQGGSLLAGAKKSQHPLVV